MSELRLLKIPVHALAGYMFWLLDLW